MSTTTAEITTQEEIAWELKVVTKDTEQPVPGVTLSNVVWNMENSLGVWVLDATNPALAVFKPSGPGIVNLFATANVTIS